MIRNMGLTDRRVRAVVGVVLVLVAWLVTSGTTSWVLGLVAVVLLATSAVGTCPAYLPFGFSTNKAS